MPLETAREAPYDLQRSPYYADWNTSKWWWGRCRREKVTETWVPARCGMLPVAELQAQFCRAFAGKSMLLVGDSVQGQLFTSLVSILGESIRHIGSGSCKRLAGADRDFRNYMDRVVKKNRHEYALQATACSNATILFLRNEVLALELTPTELKSWSNHTKVNSHHFMCDFREAAARASVVVLNRGLHRFADSPWTLHPLSDIFRYLSSGGGASVPRVIYRSTMAPRCDGRVELNVAENLTYSVKNKFNWRKIKPQNELARAVVEKHGGWFLDVYQMSIQNGKRKVDCVHSCLPGPAIDECALALLMLANAVVGD